MKIEKKHAFLIVGALTLFALSIFAYAFSPSGTGGVPSAMGHSVDEMDWGKAISSIWFRPSANANLKVVPGTIVNGGVDGAVTLSVANDANSVNTPLEIRASKTSFTTGDVCTTAGGSEKCLSTAGRVGGVLTPGVNTGGSCNDRCAALGRTCGFGFSVPYWGGEDLPCDYNNPGVRWRCWCN